MLTGQHRRHCRAQLPPFAKSSLPLSTGCNCAAAALAELQTLGEIRDSKFGIFSHCSHTMRAFFVFAGAPFLVGIFPITAAIPIISAIGSKFFDSNGKQFFIKGT
jgi:hypothetical protein